VTKDGVIVEVSIIRLENEMDWSLEVVNAANTSIVWGELFATDDEALAEFERTVAETSCRLTLRKSRFGQAWRAEGESALRAYPSRGGTLGREERDRLIAS
jgi:hypothetical protein